MWLFLAGYFSVGTYFEFLNNTHMVYTMYHIFIRYIFLSMIIYYSIIWFFLKINYLTNTNV